MFLHFRMARGVPHCLILVLSSCNLYTYGIIYHADHFVLTKRFQLITSMLCQFGTLKSQTLFKQGKNGTHKTIG